MLECVVNISEGVSADMIGRLTEAAGTSLLDVHSDPHHHRSVFTLAGHSVEADMRSLAKAAVEHIDLRVHQGVHPRLGVVDVVPFVPLTQFGSDMGDALAARDRFLRWLGEDLQVPGFLYGPERSLPDVRRHAFTSLPPDGGPTEPHPSAGACAVGARPFLVAYNLWLQGDSATYARRIAAGLRDENVRSLGLDVGGRAQVSCNLVNPTAVGPQEVYDRVAEVAEIGGTELVGLVPQGVLEATKPDRWKQLDLGPDKTIEARIKSRLDEGKV